MTKTITYGRIYIANGMTVSTMKIIKTARWKNFSEGNRRKLFPFLRFTTQSSLKPFLTAELNCFCQSKDSFLEQKFECKEEDKIIEIIEG